MARESLGFVSGRLHGVFSLQGVQEVKPVLLDKGTMVHIFVLHIIFREFWEAILCCDIYIIFSEIAITYSPVVLVVHVAIFQSGVRVLSQIVHLMYAVSAMEYANPKVFHNIIVNLFYLILIVGPVLPPHASLQI